MTSQTVTTPEGSEVFRRLKRTSPNIDIDNPYEKRIVLSGWPGAGKTAFAMSIPHCLVLDCEGGACEWALARGLSQDSPAFPWRITEWEEIQAALKFLEDDQAKPTYKMVAIDTLDSLAGSALSILARYVVREENKARIARDPKSLPINYVADIPNGAGWNRIAQLAAETMDRITSLGYGMVVLVHLSRKREEVTPDSASPGAEKRLVERVTDNLFRSVKEHLKKNVQYAGVIERWQEQRPVRKIVQTPSGPREVDAGQEAVRIHQVAFTSKDPLLDEQLKARIIADTCFEFNETNGWPKFVESFQKGLRLIKEKHNVASV